MDFVNRLQEKLDSERISTNETVLRQHSKDESYHDPVDPQVVVFPKNTEEVSEILKIAAEYEIPVIPFGVGSSLEGHVIPTYGGITIDFTLMDKILEIRPQDFLVRVQPGVTRTQLNKELKKYGLFFTVDPGADATIGGMVATNASGTTSVRYGVMRDQVRDLQVVLADGRVIHTGNLAEKSSSGLHLNGLFVGSEGTLGCFTEITLKVFGIPEYKMAARASFPSISQAVNAVTSILSAGIPIARCELIDTNCIKKVNAYSQTDYIEQPTLFLEFHGNEAGLKQDVEFTKEIVKDEGCKEIIFETNSKAAHQLWEARHNVAYAFIHSAPGKGMITTDVCVPMSELAGAIEDAHVELEKIGLDGGIVGHVGDGNFHTAIMIDKNDPEDIAKAEAFNKQIVGYALERGGTCTGEHGIGKGKKKYLRKEHGEALSVMIDLKRMLDPKGILNPDTLFDKY